MQRLAAISPRGRAACISRKAELYSSFRELPMRRVLLLLVGLFILGVVACRWESASAPGAAPPAPRWLRTTDGWERAGDVLRDRSLYAPPLHPLTVAAGQLLVALAAFLLFPPKRSLPQARSAGEGEAESREPRAESQAALAR
jgi:hypothetical protein